MAASASVRIVNDTDSLILITGVSHVNDDPTFHGIKSGDRLSSGESKTLSMGNESFIGFPRGVGCDITFVCQENFKPGHVHFDDPAIGKHSFSFGDTSAFHYKTETESDDFYQVKISLA